MRELILFNDNLQNNELKNPGNNQTNNEFFAISVYNKNNNSVYTSTCLDIVNKIKELTIHQLHNEGDFLNIHDFTQPPLTFYYGT